jgi:RNA polymerase sigma-70 factor, ECF subfamily
LKRITKPPTDSPSSHSHPPDSGSPREASDLHLLRRIAAGDSDALGLLYQRWKERIRGSASRVLRHYPDKVDDAVSEAVVLIHGDARAGKLPEEDEAVPKWIRTRAKIAAHRQIDRKHDRGGVPVDRVARATEPATMEDPQAEAALDGRRSTLRRAMRKLPPLVREAVNLRYVEGRSYREIARIQGGEPAGACSRVRAGVFRLVADTHARKQTTASAGKTLSLTRAERARVMDLAASIQARNPAIGLESLIMEVCRRTGILIGPQSRLVKLLGHSPRRS